MMKCSHCLKWVRDTISDQFLPEDEVGECNGLPGDKVDIELKSGPNGAIISKVETAHDFFCGYFAQR